MARETVIWALERDETNPAYEGVIYGGGRLLTDGEIADIVARASANGYHTFRASHWTPATDQWEKIDLKALAQ